MNPLLQNFKIFLSSWMSIVAFFITIIFCLNATTYMEMTTIVLFANLIMGCLLSVVMGNEFYNKPLVFMLPSFMPVARKSIFTSGIFLIY